MIAVTSRAASERGMANRRTVDDRLQLTEAADFKGLFLMIELHELPSEASTPFANATHIYTFFAAYPGQPLLPSVASKFGLSQ